MTKTTLRAAAVSCLALWAAIWLLFLLLRFSSLDLRVIPGIGPIMLIALVAVLVAPVAAVGVAGVALIRHPRAPLSWLALGCALAALLCQGILFTVTSWL